MLDPRMKLLRVLRTFLINFDMLNNIIIYIGVLLCFNYSRATSATRTVFRLNTDQRCTLEDRLI